MLNAQDNKYTTATQTLATKMGDLTTCESRPDQPEIRNLSTSCPSSLSNSMERLALLTTTCYRPSLVQHLVRAKDQLPTAVTQRHLTDCSKLSTKQLLGPAKDCLVLPTRQNRREESDGEQYQTSLESSDSEDVPPSDEGMFSATDEPSTSCWPTNEDAIDDTDTEQQEEEEVDYDEYGYYGYSDDLNSNLVINGKQMDMSSERYSVLSYEQVIRLDSVMDEVMPIHGRGNFPTLEVKLKDLVQVVKSKLVADGVTVRDIRLNGGAASYVLSSVKQHTYTDLDLIFGVDLSNHRSFDRVRSAVLDSLLDFLPEDVNKKRMSSCTLKEAYVHKMVKVTEGGDRWSLISLCNNKGRDVEIKFVDTMKRQFEFSVDSFQIILDSLLLFYECSDTVMNISENIFPTVVGESVYGNFNEALRHLQRKVIATRNPEEIRGGGLLKYCRLQVMGYRPARYDEIKHLERYMCSRFFIDFSDINVQRVKLANYLKTHFQDDDQTKYDYLMILHDVVDESTVCLMGHERRQTLSLIEEFAYHFYYQDQQRQMAKNNQIVSSKVQAVAELPPAIQEPPTPQTVSLANQQTTVYVGTGGHFFISSFPHHHAHHHHHPHHHSFLVMHHHHHHQNFGCCGHCSTCFHNQCSSST